MGYPKISWLDMLVYRLFYWRWSKLLAKREDLRIIFKDYLDHYDCKSVEAMKKDV